MSQVHPNIIRQLGFISVILLLLYILWHQTAFMFSAILGALTFWTLMRKKMRMLVIQRHWPRYLAALTLMCISFLIIVLPFAVITSVLADRFYPLVSDPGRVSAYIDKMQLYMVQNFGVDIFNAGGRGNIAERITSYVSVIVSSAVVTLSNLVILYFVLYFMLIRFDAFEEWVLGVLPLKRSNKTALLKEMESLVMSNAVSIPLLALFQGAVATTGYVIFHVDDPILWGIITGLCSVIPFIGTMAAWLPIGLYLIASGDAATGIWVMVWGFFVVGSTDNIFRLMLQRKLADVHPLITLFGVIIGVNLFGFFGLIFGPLMISMFILLLKIYKDEFGDNAAEEIDVVKQITKISREEQQL